MPAQPYTAPTPGTASLVLQAPLPAPGATALVLTGPPAPYTAPAHDAVALVLSQELPGTALTLGAEGAAPQADEFDSSLTVHLPLRASLPTVQGFGAALAGRITLRASLAASYDNAVWRGPGAQVASVHQPAASAHAGQALAWTGATARPADKINPWQGAQPTPARHVGAWSAAQAAPITQATAWGQAAQDRRADAQLAWAYARATRLGSALAWQQSASARAIAAALSTNQARSTPHAHAWAWGRCALARQRIVRAGFDRAARAAKRSALAPWQQARTVASYGGPWVPWVPPPVPPLPVRVTLRLCQPLEPRATLLVLGGDPCGGYSGAALGILPARYYMAVHSITAQRLPDLAALPIYNVSLGADTGSSVWTFSANGPDALWDALTPSGAQPCQLRITLDGLAWVFIVDGLQRQSEFGKRGVRVSGRSATALIAAPYARETFRNNSELQTAQQLAQAALLDSGVALDWGLDDWAVGIGAWSHGGTPLAAVQAIAEAAGGYVGSHRSAPTLQVRHPYPTLAGGIPGGPWHWDDPIVIPDVELAPDALITTSVERKDSAAVNALYVAGTTQGVLARVLREGSAGDVLAPMVTHPLITHADAARQRALAVLGAAGAKHLVSVTLPVLTGAGQPGVLDVGQLVQINDPTPWRARVRAVSVQASAPTLRQSIQLERHL